MQGNPAERAGLARAGRYDTQPGEQTRTTRFA
jgi:hypothetical protein